MLDFKNSFILAITLHLCLALIMWQVGAFGSTQSLQANNLYINLINLNTNTKHTIENNINPQPQSKEKNIEKIEETPKIEPKISPKAQVETKQIAKKATKPVKKQEKTVQKIENNQNSNNSKQDLSMINSATANINKVLIAGASVNMSRQAKVELDTINYPRTARMRGEEGVCSLLLTINEKSQIENAKITKSSGFSRLDEVALKLVLDKNAKHKIDVALNNGIPIVSNVQVNVQFKLN